jgi:hypothetical protein
VETRTYPRPLWYAIHGHFGALLKKSTATLVHNPIVLLPIRFLPVFAQGRMWTTLRVAQQPARASNNKKSNRNGKKKKGNPSEPWESIATPLPNAFKGFRFAPISLRETATPPLSAVAASLRHRRVGSGGMSDSCLTRRMRGFHKRASRKEHVCHATGGEAGKGRNSFATALRLPEKRYRTRRWKRELGCYPPTRERIVRASAAV